jgi:glycosyltransferase involved in cell wall biosynthesis
MTDLSAGRKRSQAVAKVVPTRILCVVQGSGGGIGRVECLLAATLSALEKTGFVQAEIIKKQASECTPGAGVTTITANGKTELSRLALARWRRTRPQVVIFGHVNLSVLSLAMKIRRPQTRFVTTVFGVDVWGGLSPARRMALRHMDRVWAISSYTANRVTDLYHIPGDRVRLMPLSLPPNFELSAPVGGRVNGSFDKPLILTVARLDASERYKGVDTVIRALPSVAASMPSVEYVIVGEGSDRARLQRLVSELKLEKRVHFLGRLDDQRLSRLYRDCDIFAMPSRKEGFGLVFLEAMAAGKPVVAAWAGGTPEVVGDHETGFLVPYGDVRALAQALTTLVNDDGLRVRMGEAAKSRVAHKYRFEHFAIRVQDLLAELG